MLDVVGACTNGDWACSGVPVWVLRVQWMSAHDGVSSTSLAERWRGGLHILWLVDGDLGGCKHVGGVLVDHGEIEGDPVNGLIQCHVVGAHCLLEYW